MEGQSLQLLKAWQYPEGLVWSARDLAGKEKGYLLWHLQSAKVIWSLQKPESTTANGVLVQQIRKYAGSGRVCKFCRVGNDIIMEWRAGSLWYLHLYKHDRELRLVDSNGLVWARISTKGSYTKKMTAAPDPRVLLQNTDQEPVELGNALSPTMAAQETKAKQPDPGDSLSPSSFQREVRRSLKRRLKTLEKSRLKNDAGLPSPQQLAKWEEEALMLQNFAYLAHFGDSQLQLSAEQTGTTDLTIELDATRSIGDNINQKFRQLSRQKRRSVDGAKQSKKLERSIAELEPLLNLLDQEIQSEAELDGIVRKFKLKTLAAQSTKSSQGVARLPYRRYQSQGNTEIFVAKSAKDGDQMLRSAKSNDFWWHVTDPKGAHVIVPRSMVKGDLLPATKRQAAILALHHSQKSKDFAGEVYQSEKRHLKKKKGLPDGLWLVEKSDIIYLTYTDEELAEITAREVL